jgi:4-amino-4-deoxy-L-arabinose transferase-like glycosyltransferase
MMTVRQRQALWAIIVVGLALRLGWALYARGDAPDAWQESGDQFSYFHYGREIAEGRGYVSYITGDATAYYPIGYPAILGVLFFVVLHTPIPNDLLLATALFHVALGTASVALVFLVGRAVASVRVGLVAATLLAVFPNVIYQVATVQLETTFIFLVLASLAVIVTHDWSVGPPSVRRLVAFGATLGVTVLVRPFAAVLLAGLAAALWSQGLGWRRVAAGVAVPLGVVVLLSVPWTIRNAVQLDAFVPSSTNMGDTLCLDRNLDAKGGFRFADHDGCADPDLPEVPRNQGSTKKAIHFVLDHPGRELLQIVRRARIMFGSDHDGIEAVQTLGGGPFLSERVVDAAEPLADWSFFGLVALAVMGLPAFARRNHRPERLLAVSGLVGLLVIPLLLWGNPRFHLPLAPFIVLSAALAIDGAWRRLHPAAPPDGP